MVLKDRKRENRGMRLITGTMIVITLAGAFWAGMFPIRGSNDPWWHFKTGEYLWNYFQEHGFKFPPYDVFTYTGENIPWINHEWLSDLIFWGMYQLGGFQAAVVMKALVLTLTIALFILYMHRNGVGWKVACLGAILVLLASQGSLFLRPPIFTYLFIVIFLHIILCFQLGEYTKTAFVLGIVAEIAWVNLHGGAIIGILLVFFWWVSDLWFCLITWMKENPTGPSIQRLNTSSGMLAAVTAASFVNPFTYLVHLLPLKVMGDRWLLENIGEMQSPNMQHYNEFELLILGLFLLPMMRAGSIWVYEGLAVVFFGHEALNHTRHIPLFALVATPPLMSALAEERKTLIPEADAGPAQAGFWGTMLGWVKWGLRYHVDVFLIFVLVAYTFGARPGKIWNRNLHDFEYLVEKGYIPGMYPENTVNFILYNNLQGPMFNHDNFAGYLIWRLSPEKIKLFTDSRYDLWGSQFAKEEEGMYGGRMYPLGYYDSRGRWWGIDPYQMRSREDVLALGKNDPEIVRWYESKKEYWEYILDKYRVNFIISYDIRNVHYILNQKYMGWVLIYHEGGYVIHVRHAPQNLKVIRKYALNHREQVPPESPEESEETNPSTTTPPPG